MTETHGMCLSNEHSFVEARAMPLLFCTRCAAMVPLPKDIVQVYPT